MTDTIKIVVNKSVRINIDMASQIWETHNVAYVSSDPQLQIQSTTAQAFSAANWSTTQPLLVIGHRVGTYKLKGVATTPYYIDKRGNLKKAIKDINVQVVPYVGWEREGSIVGPNVFPMLVASLKITDTNPLNGYGQNFYIESTIPGGSGISYVLFYPSGGTSACDTDIYGRFNFTANEVGTYYAYAFIRAAGNPVSVDFAASLKFGSYAEPELTITGVPVAAVPITITTSYLADGTTSASGTKTLLSLRRSIRIRGLGTSTPGSSPSGLAGSFGTYFYTDSGYLNSSTVQWNLVGPSIVAPQNFTLNNYISYKVLPNEGDTVLKYGSEYIYSPTPVTIPFSIP